MESIKSCIDCGVFLTDKTGYRRKGGGYLSRCKSCHGFYVKDRYDNPRRGGLSALEYDTLLDDSRGNCHCCGTRGLGMRCGSGVPIISTVILALE